MSDNNKYLMNTVDLSSIRNKMELKVIQVMKQIIGSFPEHDQCDLCIEDAYALSLNYLPAKYAQYGSIVLKSEYPKPEEIVDAVSRAIQEVAKHPRHQIESEANE
ncbi:late competence development ComFB family protein [bacterium]|nr:late competence development ComFB family protein [bacterium]